MITVRACTIAELEATPNLGELLHEYAAESSMHELGPVSAQVETYRKLEASGMFHPIGAFEDDTRCVGFILPLVITLPHYGVLAATIESFFVPYLQRKKGIGLLLLRKAEELARGLGAKALLLSAPVHSDLAYAMHHRRAYRHSNEVFVRELV